MSAGTPGCRVPFHFRHPRLRLTTIGLVLLSACATYFWVGFVDDDDGGASPEGGGALGQSAVSPGCRSTGDRAVIAERADALKSDVQMCALRCVLFDSQRCMLGCLGGMGFTDGCAVCWVRLATCSKRQCISRCLVPNSWSCRQCAHDKCFPSLVSCTGVPRDTLPLRVHSPAGDAN
mmetsp:Transcript_158263/g.507625  ORF Transcript_158263/g.507625 Transcript_158263/m.507625 type:complete len:177 (-) Transcript_158263:66-596(-)